MITVSPQLGALLVRATQTPDIETALWKVLSEYLELKTRALDERIATFERKWGMAFEEFSRRCEEGKLEKGAFSYEVEKDFWGWEKAVTLKRHYEALKAFGLEGLSPKA